MLLLSENISNEWFNMETHCKNLGCNERNSDLTNIYFSNSQKTPNFSLTFILLSLNKGKKPALEFNEHIFFFFQFTHTHHKEKEKKITFILYF